MIGRVTLTILVLAAWSYGYNILLHASPLAAVTLLCVINLWLIVANLRNERRQ